MKESLYEQFEDELGNIDFRRNAGMGKKKEAGRFIAEVRFPTDSPRSPTDSPWILHDTDIHS
jgi:hypothetical protein